MIPQARALRVDDAVIQRTTSGRELAAGRAYALRGRVRNLVATDGGSVLQADTLGTAPKPYRQHIVLLPQSDGTLGFDGTCTCPVGHNCKHVAAVLIAARVQPPLNGAIAGNEPAQPASGPALRVRARA